MPTVDLPGTFKLCEQAEGELRCVERGSTIDARAGQELFLHHDDYVDSERFRLDDQVGTVKFHVAPGSRGARTFSIVLMALGGSATLACGVGLPVAAQSVTGQGTAVGTCFGLGLVAFSVSLPLFFVNRTTYTLSGGDSSSGLGALRF
jgi:hypothetical protein